LTGIVKIKFRSFFHAGSYASDLDAVADIVHSWTIYGAIGHSAALMYEAQDVKEFIRSLKLSSLLPLNEMLPIFWTGKLLVFIHSFHDTISKVPS